MTLVVSDTSPVRALAHVGRLDFLKVLYGEVWVPLLVDAKAAGLLVSVRPGIDGLEAESFSTSPRTYVGRFLNRQASQISS